MEKLMRLPPGFRFHPTDEELVVQYLKRKAFSCPLPAAIIQEIDLRKYDPWDLPGCYEGERYFFNLQETKYRNGKFLFSRATMSGYWKATGKDRPVIGTKHNEIVGMKKTLVFYQGKLHHGVRTHWIMHEYRLVDHQTLASAFLHRKNSTQSSLVQGKDWVACRIFMKKSSPKNEEANLRVRNNSIRFIDTTNDDRDFQAHSPSSSSSCVTDVSDEECSIGEETSSKSIT